MSLIDVQILGREELLRRMRDRRNTLVPRLTNFMLGRMARLADYIRENKLSGQVLRNRTGTLRRSIHPSVTTEGEGTVIGRVGTNVSYARIHEFGGTVTVPAHERTITQAWGRPITPRRISVRSYSATYPERAFLRPSLNEQRESILQDLRNEAMRILREP